MLKWMSLAKCHISSKEIELYVYIYIVQVDESWQREVQVTFNECSYYRIKKDIFSQESVNFHYTILISIYQVTYHFTFKPISFKIRRIHIAIPIADIMRNIDPILLTVLVFE